MSSKKELEFTDLKELNALLKQAENRGKKQSARGGSRRNNSKSSMKSQAAEQSGRSRRGRKNQSGGNPTPLPWQYFHGDSAALNTQGPAANNYGQMSAQAVGSPTAGYGFQTGGAFPSQWGTNEPTFNALGKPNANTIYGGGNGVTLTREETVDIISSPPVANLDDEDVEEFLDAYHGKRDKYTEAEMMEAIGAIMEQGGGGRTRGRRARKQREQRGGNPTPLPWQYFHGDGAALNTQGPMANNYGRMPAQSIGTPTAGYGYQVGGMNMREAAQAVQERLRELPGSYHTSKITLAEIRNNLEMMCGRDGCSNDDVEALAQILSEEKSGQSGGNKKKRR